jgi:transcriptional regulator with XRE-family HTH domain
MDSTRFAKVFDEMGKRYRDRRLDLGMVQEDVIEYGFSVRHYQQLEDGRPHSLATMFRIAEMFKVNPVVFIKGLVLPPRKKGIQQIAAELKERRKRRIRSRK